MYLASAKYLQAITVKELECLGSQVGLGYDIDCSFETTINNSSLAELFQQLKWRCCVDSFHSYIHSYNCQLCYHLNIIKGMRLENLETLEHIFSFLNQLAAVT